MAANSNCETKNRRFIFGLYEVLLTVKVLPCSMVISLFLLNNNYFEKKHRLRDGRETKRHRAILKLR